MREIERWVHQTDKSAFVVLLDLENEANAFQKVALQKVRYTPVGMTPIGRLLKMSGRDSAREKATRMGYIPC